MHGRKKKTLSDTEIENLRTKTDGYNRLAAAISDMKKAEKRDVHSLDLVDKMTLMNPDFYSLWNYRREILNDIYNSFDAHVVERELNVSSDAIKKNPKSYCAWHHRLWVWSKVDIDISKELELCDRFLTMDQRNFHCWNYRRAIIRLGKIDHLSEISFSMKKIEENFSNYSAFHHRSVYIKDTVCDLAVGLQEELGIVHNAIFTEPDDQSAWWYYQFLMNWAKAAGESNAESLCVFRTILSEEIETIRSLRELENESKWAMVTQAFLLQMLVNISTACEVDQLEETRSERCSLLRKLCELDTSHRNRYLSMLAT